MAQERVSVTSRQNEGQVWMRTTSGASVATSVCIVTRKVLCGSLSNGDEERSVKRGRSERKNGEERGRERRKKGENIKRARGKEERKRRT